MKKILFFIVTFALLLLVSHSVFAIEFTPTKPIPGVVYTSLSAYISTIYTYALGIAGILAVFMMVIGGIQYMASEGVTNKSEAKDRILQAIYGLLLLLGVVIILNTLNLTQNGQLRGVPSPTTPGAPSTNQTAVQQAQQRIAQADADAAASLQLFQTAEDRFQQSAIENPGRSVEDIARILTNEILRYEAVSLYNVALIASLEAQRDLAQLQGRDASFINLINEQIQNQESLNVHNLTRASTLRDTVEGDIQRLQTQRNTAYDAWQTQQQTFENSQSTGDQILALESAAAYYQHTINLNTALRDHYLPASSMTPDQKDAWTRHINSNVDSAQLLLDSVNRQISPP